MYMGVPASSAGQVWVWRRKIVKLDEGWVNRASRKSKGKTLCKAVWVSHRGS